MEYKNQLIILLHVFVAAVLSGIVGYEREMAKKPAGLRTHMIIGSVAALLINLGRQLILSYQADFSHVHLQFDPIRTIEAIIVGVSFIGAGTIFKSENAGEKVQYLTTAATTLFSAGIGISVGLNNYLLAAGLALLSLLINYVVKIINIRMPRDKEIK